MDFGEYNNQPDGYCQNGEKVTASGGTSKPNGRYNAKLYIFEYNAPLDFNGWKTVPNNSGSTPEGHNYGDTYVSSLIGYRTRLQADNLVLVVSNGQLYNNKS